MNLFIAFRHITTSYTSQIIRCIPLQVFDSFPPSYQCSPSVKAARLLGKIMPNFWPVSSCPARCWWDTRRLWTTGTTRIWMPSMNPTGPSLRDGSLRPKKPGDHGDLSLFSIGEVGCWGFIFGIWIIYGLFMDDLWMICGLFVDYLWIIYGLFMDDLWIICGLFMDYLWIIYGWFDSWFYQTHPNPTVSPPLVPQSCQEQVWQQIYILGGLGLSMAAALDWEGRFFLAAFFKR